MNYKNEKEVAQKAEQLLTAALRQSIGSLGFKNHVSKQGSRILDSFSESKYKIGKSQLEDGNRYYFNQLVLKMPRHAYIQHYGDRGVRAGGDRTRHNPRIKRYNYRTHKWVLPEKDFIDDAIQKSGVVDFVLNNVAEIRGEQVVAYLKYFFEEGKRTSS